MQTWNQSLAVGHPAIDQQHQELFAHADRLSAALRAGRAKEEVLHQVAYLRDYCHLHFRSEEALMRERSYPFAAVHQANHRDFERRLAAIEEKAAAKGASSAIALEVSALVKGWLIDHIGVEDVKVAAFLRQRSSVPAERPPPPPAERPPPPPAQGAPVQARGWAKGDASELARAAAELERINAARSARPRVAAPAPRQGATAAADESGRADLAKLAREAGVTVPVLERVLLVLRYYDLA